MHTVRVRFFSTGARLERDALTECPASSDRTGNTPPQANQPQKHALQLLSVFNQSIHLLQAFILFHFFFIIPPELSLRRVLDFSITGGNLSDLNTRREPDRYLHLTTLSFTSQILSFHQRQARRNIFVLIL